MNMNNHNSTDEELRVDIKLGEALNRLYTNDDFLLVIGESYLTNELYKASEEFTSYDDTVVKHAHSKVDGIARLKEHLNTISINAENAKNELGR
jgi:hypothetical protein